MMIDPQLLPVLLAGLADESKHFLLAFSLGALVFALTSITWYVFSLVYRLLTRRSISMGVDYGMFICCLLLGLSAALLSHYLLDYYSTWYVTPFNGAPLELRMP